VLPHPLQWHVPGGHHNTPLFQQATRIDHEPRALTTGRACRPCPVLPY
jgi:hypothetical protein